ncbi:hypothetical protein CHH28_15095 [Bacterioplanes sanyensis]|uniref:LysM domain-containing protein n=1 Tax=Bacterioplanes sanyensis TaxID=1249553 RepID=A0A222FLL7_9GAMM|nr:FimV/HubP family polar landmark protein [Bacterioplanes sanyensis]ASP39915.1 hypothetical protein CHH28_15095 [Bacterioplanes sanyensis]
MKRLLANTLMLAGGLTISGHTLALGLGELELDSALNQPLKAEISLVEAEDLSQWEIKPKLASPQDFENAGVDRVFFLTKIDFKVDGDKIVLSTREPVTEPFLNFLVELNWPAGRVLREYTVLLDPPVFAEDSVAPLAITTPATVDSVYVEQPGSETVERTEVVTSGMAVDRQDWTQEPSEPGTYKVKQNDTLWNIALQTRPDRSVSPQRMMVAIQQANPDAFIGGNINRLKTHKVLRIPAADELQTIAEQQALAEVARQNKDLTASAAQLSATGRSTSAEPSAMSEGDGEVRLLSPSEKQQDIAGSSGEVASDMSDGRQQALENDLAIAMEDLDSSRRENQELRERLQALEEQIETLQSLITLKDDQLANMQLPTESDDSVGEQPYDTANETGMADETDMGGELQDSSGQDDSIDFNYSEPAAEEPAQQSVPEPQAEVEPTPSVDELAAAEERRRQLAERIARESQQAQPSIIDTLLSPVTLGISALVLGLLALLGFRVAKKRKEAAADAEDAIEVPESEINPSADAGQLDDFDFDADDQLDKEPVDLSDDAEPLAGLDEATDEGDEFSPVAQTEDVISESDIYIAYGKFDQAIELLTGAIEDEPSRTDLRLKLLEVLVEMDDSQAFAEAEGALNMLGDHQASSQAEQMRSRLSSPQAPTGAAGMAAAAPGSLETDVPELDDGLADEFNQGLDFSDALDMSDSGQTSDNVEDIFANTDSADDSTDALDFDASLDLGADDAADDLGSDSLEDVPTLDLDADLGDSLDFDLNDSSLETDDGVDDLAAELPQADSDEDGLEFDLSDFGTDGSADADEAPVLDVADAEGDDNSLEFDLGALQDEGTEESELTDVPELPVEDDNVVDFAAAETDASEELGADDALAELEAELEQSSFDAEPAAEAAQDGIEEVTDAGDFMAELETLSDTTTDEGDDPGDFDLSADMAELDDDLGDFSAGSESDELPTLEAEADAEPELEAASVDSEPMPAEAPSAGGRSTDDIDLDELAAADDEFDFLAGTDECATKLDLARAYIDMEDADGAKELLQEVIQEGSDQQKQEARSMMDNMS